MDEEKYVEIIKKQQQANDKLLGAVESMVSSSTETQKIHKEERLKTVKMLVIGFVITIVVTALANLCVNIYFTHKYFNYSNEYEMTQDEGYQNITNNQGGDVK